jgi:transposase-like protein
MKTITKIVYAAVVALVLACFSPSTDAAGLNPPPDGGYPGGNTAEGQSALLSLTTGGFNTAVGFFSLRSDTTGQFNTAIGAGTLLANTADQNTATGAGALLSNINGFQNTADGAFALFSNTTGFQNTATGEFALFSNTSGNYNTATGFDALINNTTGDQNTANGVIALSNNTTGSFNTALGVLAGSGVFTADNVIAIGTNGADVSNSCFIGNIRGVTTANADAIPVLIDSAGQLGTVSSSKRFKKEIKPMDSGSEAILALNPVTFQYKSDKSNTPQFGLIAEEVAQVNPDLVVRDENGEVYTVRYDAVNAMLLNEFLKEHRKVEEEEAIITQLKSTVSKQDAILAQQQKGMEVFVARLDQQAAQIQKVSARLEETAPAPKAVVNNP